MLQCEPERYPGGVETCPILFRAAFSVGYVYGHVEAPVLNATEERR